MAIRDTSEGKGPASRPRAEPAGAPAGVAEAIDRLVDEWRVQCLWYARADYYPRTDQERVEVLEAIQERCDLDTFRRAGALKTWLSPHATLAGAGLAVEVAREAPAFVQASVSDGQATEVLQWVQDSAYRFFPLLESDVFGLTLHPLDHATNKVLALAGRRKVRDWVDALHCHEQLQPLGYLAWAAAGKDPGLSPSFILEQAARTRYVQRELDQLDFEGPTPSAAELSARWHRAVEEGREIIKALPAESAGRCVLDQRGRLERASPAALGEALASGGITFHEGSIRGAFPELQGLDRGGSGR